MIRALFALALTVLTATAAAAQQVPLAFCSLSSMSAATPLSSCSYASFTGTGNGQTLTVSSVTGFIPIGATLSGTGVPSSPATTITSQLLPLGAGESLGGAGRYQTNNPTTSNGASLTAGGIPQGTKYAIFCAYTQGVVYRDDGAAPTGTQGSGGQGIVPQSSTVPTCIPYTATFSKVQFIQQTSGAILGASFYKMMLRVAVAILIAAAISVGMAVAQTGMPMVPFTQESGPMSRLGGPMIPGTSGGTGPTPPTCSNSLDFSDQCNSQYLAMRL